MSISKNDSHYHYYQVMLAHIFWVLKLCQASWYICFLQLILTQLCESCPSLQMRKLSTGTPHFWDGWGRGHSGIHLSVSIMKLQTLHSVWGKKKPNKRKTKQKKPWKFSSQTMSLYLSETWSYFKKGHFSFQNDQQPWRSLLSAQGLPSPLPGLVSRGRETK